MQFCATSVFHGGLTRYLPISIVDRRFFHFWRNHSQQFKLLEFLFFSSPASPAKISQTVFFLFLTTQKSLIYSGNRKNAGVPFVNCLESIKNPFKTLIRTGVSAIKKNSQPVGTGNGTEFFYSDSLTQNPEFTTLKILL